MKRVVFFLLTCALASPLWADDEACKNGDFEKGKFGWDSTPGVRVVEETVPGKPINRVMEINCHRSERRSIWQRITVGNKVHTMQVAFKMKALPDYQGATPEVEQFSIRYERRGGGSTFLTLPVEKTGEWEDVKFDMTDFTDSQTIVFSIEMHPAQGRVWIDDVKIKRIGG